MRRVYLQLMAVLALPLLAWGTENFPPPEFTTGYQFPRTSAPLPRAEVFAYVDIAVLAALLCLTAWFVHRQRSRRDLFLLTLFSLLYFGFYRHGCVCAVGSIQNVALAIWQSAYALPLVVGLIFLLPLLAALFAGRIFCAAVCPLGAIQDILLHRPVKVPAWLDQPLSLLPYVYLGAAVLFAATGSLFVICDADPFVAFFRLGGSLPMIVTGAALLLIGIFVGRPYCRYLCPYGVLLRFLAPFAKWRMAITAKECVQCHLCADACPFGAIKPPTPAAAATSRGAGRGRLAAMLLLLPLLLLLGGWFGYRMSGSFARLHPVVKQADAAWQQERGENEAKGSTGVAPASPHLAHYRQAAAVRRQFANAAPLFGAWLGLVVGLKLLFLALRRRRSAYEIDQAACLACGRCYESCPLEQAQVQETETGTNAPAARKGIGVRG